MKTFSIILLILITCMSSFACSCIGKASLEEEYKNVNAVLFGEIVSFEFATIKEEGEMPIPTSDSTYEISKFFTMRIVRYELKIEKVYKGKVKLDTIEIYTGLGGGDCGYPFEVGKKYLVFGLNKSYMDITRKKV